VVCAACNKTNRDDARFCRGCGAPLARACAGCGAALPDDASFCDRCGAPAGAAPPAPSSYTPAHLAARIRASRATLEGERKHVTVLFADVVGSTSIAERIDPEEMRGMMDRCFGQMLEEVHRYEGTVIQFTGDGIMAIFGAPLALEDAPRRAILAALAIQRTIGGAQDRLRTTSCDDLQMRIGIHSGLVVVGRIGNDLRMEYTAIGDTTNLAARLQTLAPPGSIVVSEATHRLAGAYFDTRDLGVHAVKGKREPVRVFEVTGERGGVGGLDARREHELTPLAGRAPELATLVEAFGAARTGRGQVVFVVGEAGIGKSRVIHEFRGLLGGEPHVWVEGRCASYGRSTAFLPLVDMWRRSLAIEDHDDEAAASAKVHGAIDALGADLAWTKPFVRLLLSLPAGDAGVEALDAATRRSETFRALKTLTLRTAEREPVVLLVEDLHWIDAASEEYLAFVADAIPTARVLLLLTHRPGHRMPFGDRSYHRRIMLTALDEHDMTSMACAILATPALPDELSALLARKAEGNPLFVEEVTKSLLEEGVLRREDGHVVLGKALSSVMVPDSIHGVLMARLDRLDDGPKQALQLASVIGREFALRLLARVTEIGDEVSTLVAELRALELIYEKTAHPELAYMFKHALTHDVAYESILLERRRALHRLIGLAIEELYAERLAEHYETLALHFTRGEDWPRAFDYHARAAEKALAAYASESAATHCREALGIAARLGTDASRARSHQVETMLGAALLFTSAFGASGEAFARAADLATDAGSRAMALVQAGGSYTWGHRYKAATAAIDEAVHLARAHGLKAAEALGLCERAFQGFVTTGDFARFLPVIDDAIRIAGESGSEQAIAHAKFTLLETLEWRGRYVEALALAEEIIPTARKHRMAALLIWSNWFQAKANCCVGDYGRSLDRLHQGLDLCERIGDRAWRTRLLNTTGWVYAEIGAEDASRDLNAQATRLGFEVGDPELIVNSEVNLALNHLRAGRLDEAEDRLGRLHAQLADGDPWMRWRWRLHVEDAQGRLALANGEPARSLALGEAELAAAERIGASKLAVRAQDLRAHALLGLDRLDDADAAIEAALRGATDIGYVAGQWRAHRLRAEAARRRGRDPVAAEAEARVAALAATLAASLQDDSLRRALHATTSIGPRAGG
jgi:class 3 adenylate cyclase